MSAVTPSAADQGSAPGVGAGGTGAGGPEAPLPAERGEDRWGQLVQNIARGNLLVVVASFVFAFIIGSILILIADEEVREAAGYFFARPSDTLTAAWQSISQAYLAMFRGAVFDVPAFTRTLESLRADGGTGTYVWGPALMSGLRPLTETLTIATPLIIAACGMAVGFRAGLFNIGGTGQLIVGAMFAGYVGFTFELPIVLHLLVALVAGVLAGGIWGGIAGFLKARFGANEVISTIMLNWIATYLLFFALKTSAFTGANQAQPTSPSVKSTAALPQLLGPQYRLHLGILIAIAVVVFLWWLMNRSTLGFQFRAVGSNPRAARVAGISPAKASFAVMAVAGALVGLAGAVHILGTEKRLTEGIAGSLGFDAITVALLGRSGPVGIVLAGLLFAGLSTGGRYMETNQGVPLDLVSVIQALVVLFIAAPPLVRTLIGLRRVDNPGAGEGRRRARATTSTPGSGSTAVPASTSTAASTGGTTAGSDATGDIPGGPSRSGPDEPTTDARTETKGEDR